MTVPVPLPVRVPVPVSGVVIFAAGGWFCCLFRCLADVWLLSGCCLAVWGGGKKMKATLLPPKPVFFLAPPPPPTPRGCSESINIDMLAEHACLKNIMISNVFGHVFQKPLFFHYHFQDSRFSLICFFVLFFLGARLVLALPPSRSRRMVPRPHVIMDWPRPPLPDTVRQLEVPPRPSYRLCGRGVRLDGKRRPPDGKLRLGRPPDGSICFAKKPSSERLEKSVRILFVSYTKPYATCTSGVL